MCSPGSVGRSRLLPNGDVETRSRTSLFYIDPASGAYLKSWRNPITGDEIEVPPLRRGVAGGTLTPTGPSVNANDALESSVFGSPAALEFKTIGERTWVSRHAFTRWTPTGGTRARSEMTLDTWIVATRDLRDTRLTTIPATSSWTSQTEWQTWLQMPEGQPGQQLWRSDGVKVSEVSALPASFVAQCRTRHRGMLSDPIVFD